MNPALSKLDDLQKRIPELAEDLRTLKTLIGVDVPSALNKIRFITEKVLRGLCEQSGISWGDAEPTLERMIGPLASAGCIPKNVALHVRTIQGNTSPGSHFQESALTPAHVTIALNALFEFLDWRYPETTFEPVNASTKAPRKHGSGATFSSTTRRRWLRLAAIGAGFVVVVAAAVILWQVLKPVPIPPVPPVPPPDGYHREAQRHWEFPSGQEPVEVERQVLVPDNPEPILPIAKQIDPYPDERGKFGPAPKRMPRPIPNGYHAQALREWVTPDGGGAPVRIERTIIVPDNAEPIPAPAPKLPN